MKKVVIIILFLNTISCNAQQAILEDLSGYEEMNYTFASITSTGIVKQEKIKKRLFGGGLYINVYEMIDSKSTPNNYSPDTHENLTSFIVSVVGDDDLAYIPGKLYKITGMYNPKILEIKEAKYPKISIKIEHGSFDNRKTEAFELKGIQ